MNWIITTCKGRLAFLKQTLPTWLERTDCAVLVVDWDCPDGASDWATSLREPRVRALSPRNTGPWNKPKALNSALRFLAAPLSVPSQRALFLDADTILWKQLSNADLGAPDEMRIVRPSEGERDLTGVLAMPMHSFGSAGLFNEDLVGYGAEDLDMRLRLYLRAGLCVTTFEPGTFTAIPHSDELRTRFSEEKSLDASGEANVRRMFLGLNAREIARVRSPEESGAMQLLLAPNLRR